MCNRGIKATITITITIAFIKKTTITITITIRFLKNKKRLRLQLPNRLHNRNIIDYVIDYFLQIFVI
jgi:hypothetical protein